MAQLDLALVGYEPPGSENLSLRLLAGAVAEAGNTVKLFLASGFDEVPVVARKAVKAQPAAIGFSAPDSENALHGLALAGLIRRQGYQGYMVCGGPFATLQPEWILQKAPAVDGIIRYDGEKPLVELLNTLRLGNEVSQIPALETREFSNPPSPNGGGPRWRPLRGRLPTVMGVPTASMIGGRGCLHRCDYCTHAAQASLVVRECREAGVSAEEIRRSGLGRPRRRPLPDLAEEMAELYHNDGARYFHFIDEALIPDGEAEALTFAREMRELFDRNRMGKVALGFMTRGDALSEPVVDALVDLGLIRTLVGVESGVAASLTALGRNRNIAAGPRAVRLLSERGVLSMFNALLLHPECTAESIRAELAYLKTIRGALFDTVQVRPFPHTKLHRRLDAEGRIVGGRLLPNFTFNDDTINLFQSLMARLQTQVLGRYTPTFRVHDLTLSALLAHRFGTGSSGMRTLAKLRDLGDRINLTRVAALESLLDVAERGDSADLAIERSAASFEQLNSELDRLEEMLNSGGSGLQLSRHYRNLAAAAAFVFAIAATPACNTGARVDDSLSGETDSDSDGDTDTDSDTDSDSDSDGDTDSDTDSDTDTETGTDTETDTEVNPECTDDEYWQEYDSLSQLVSGNCDFWQYPVDVLLVLDDEGTVVDVTVQAVDSVPAGWLEQLQECYLELLADEEFPCLAKEEIWIYGGFPGDFEV